jgi:hypothetical protein
MIHTRQKGKLSVGDESIQLNGEFGWKEGITITSHKQRRRNEPLKIIRRVV